jgi:putative transposase
MKQSKFSESQIVAILGSVGKDKNVENVCREHGISPATFYNWKSKYGGMGTEDGAARAVKTNARFGK